jgi:hypothetical protein
MTDELDAGRFSMSLEGAVLKRKARIRLNNPEWNEQQVLRQCRIELGICNTN